MSLRGRLAIVTAIAIVVTGTVVLLFTSLIARSAMREQVFKSMEGVVSRTAQEIQITLRSLSTQADTLSANPRLSQAMEAYAANPQDAVAAAEVKGILSGSAGSFRAAAAVQSTGGSVVAVTGHVPAVDPEALKEVQAAHPVLVFTIDGTDLVLTMAVGLSSPAGNQLVGVLIVEGQAPELQSELTDTAGLGSSGKLLLSQFIAQKVSVASFVGTGSSQGMVRLPLDSDLPPARAARGEQGHGEFSGLGKQKVVASYNYIPGVGWGLTATEDSAEAFLPIERLRNVSIIVILVLFVGGAALAYMIARTTSRPLIELQEGVKALAGGDMSTRVKISDGIEVTALADEFNRMAGKLNDSYANLEKKVEERTAELQEVNQRLKELDDLKSDFVSMASHELRSPMASMKMGVSTVLKEMVGPLNEEQKTMLEIADRNIDRLTKLTSELLDLTKIEAGQLDITLEDHDMLELANEVVEAAGPLALSKGVKLTAEARPGPVIARCDHDRIYQVIQNIVGNALNFTEDGSVTIKVESAGDSVRVCVKDTGPGIPPEAVSTIFEKWSQAHSETRSEKRGTGLGLAICKGIVEAHGGRISVETEVGRGTMFCFTLPVSGPDERQEDNTDRR